VIQWQVDLIEQQIQNKSK